ncbi:Aspartate aminotransferase [hydrothermal vent metagenome]|uniref:Aspartate aminotransferase n=1 Tax=hydrothermal vent metagenome TaxID=652676 RepID=A0A3B1BTA2_9ZZZZ
MEKIALADRLSQIKPSPTVAITVKAKAMKAEGIDIVGFGAGEPDFDTPDFVKQAAIDALKAGETKYTDAPGLPRLRDALAAYYKKTEQLDYQRAETIISNGGKHSLYNIFQALLSEGDEVIIPTPYWVSYPDQVMLAGGKPVYLATKEEDGFLFTADDLKKLVTQKTRAIIVNTPSNPSGAVYDKKTLEGICEVAVENKILVVWDEIYKDIYYGEGSLRSLPFYNPDVKPYTLICGGLSKNFSMTGWRIGWVLGDARIVKAMSMIQGQSTSNPVTFAQFGAIAALEKGPVHIGEWLKQFEARRDKLLEAFDEIDGMSCVKPMGSFYVFPNISGLYGKKWTGGEIKDSYDVTKFLLEEAKVAVVPGAPFGSSDNIRISYALAMNDIVKGIDRIKQAVKNLR